MVAALNKFYRETPAFYEKDRNSLDLEWIDKSDSKNSIFSYYRADNSGKRYACFHNFSPNTLEDYVVTIPPELRRQVAEMKQVFSSDAKEFGGSTSSSDVEFITDDQGNATAFKVTIPPLSTTILEEILSEKPAQ